MRLSLFKTLWGHAGTLAQALEAARQNGFDGLEAVPPLSSGAQREWRAQLDESDLDFIAEIPTTGDYVPLRDAATEAHLGSLCEGLEAAKILRARHVSCVGGCDAWSAAQNVEFFGAALNLAKDFEMPISFETHRSRSTFTPWATCEVLRQLPAMRLTCDFSHWCAVLERLPDSEPDAMELCFERADHIHARVGHAQGPQVSDPRAPEFAAELSAHQNWWTQIWRRQRARGLDVSTLTPEFGPPNYAPALPYTRMPVCDIELINAWMAQRQRAQFESFFRETF